MAGSSSGQARACAPPWLLPWAPAVLGAWLALMPGVAWAEGAEPAGCAAVLEAGLEDELLARIRGQSRDVACELAVGADERAADATLAIERAADGAYTLSVRVHADGSVHTRSVPAAPADPNDALARSAAFEAVALVVRGELLELARASEARREAQAAREAAAASARAQADAKRPPVERSAASRAEDERDQDDADFALALGWELAATGMPDPAHALTGRALLALGPIELGLGGAFGFATAFDDDYVHAEVRRHAVLGVLALPLLRTGAFRVVLSASVGVLLFARRSAPRDPALVATPDATAIAFAAGVEAAAELRLLGPLALRVGLAADAVPAAPRFVYELSGAAREGAAPLYVQPRGGVGLVVRLP